MLFEYERPRPFHQTPTVRARLAYPTTYHVPSGATPAQVVKLCEEILKGAGVKAEIVRKSPTWRPGDVVVVYYGPQRNPYTYVRGRENWLVEQGREPKTDEFMTAQLDAGRAKPVLQAGGEPFDGGRL
ncbi:hypothetical protein ACFWDN_21260 [Micromonospora chalcea]